LSGIFNFEDPDAFVQANPYKTAAKKRDAMQVDA
jgi:hypothetical protein